MTVRIVTALSFGMWGGCSGDDPIDEDTDTTDGEAEDTEETGTPEDNFTGNEGSIVLVQYAASVNFDEYVEGYAVFLDDAQGVLNLAHCWPGWATCVSSYPASGTAAEGEDPEFLFYADTYDVDPLLVGSTPNELSNYTQWTYFDWYWDNVSGWGGTGIVSLDGDYAPYTGTDDFAYPTEMVLTAPDPTETIVADSDDVITLTWEPASDGMVLLEWGNTVTVLEDDGSHDLAVADIDKLEPIDQIQVRLSRVIDTDVDAAGNLIHVQTRSEQIFLIDYLGVEEYTELVVPAAVAEDCEEAALLPSLAPGLYWGDLSVSDDDEAPGDYGNDLTGWEAPGNDVVARIDLLAGQTLSVEYSTPYDASMYLLTDTCDEDDGLVGADDLVYEEPETLEWEADVDGPVYLVLDSFFEDGWYYWVEIEIDGP